MKSKKSRKAVDAPVAVAAAPQAPRVKTWHIAAAFAVAVAAAFLIYSPALNGAFVFDDLYLPFLSPSMAAAELKHWLGVRPLLMFSYWVNYQMSELDPVPYHAFSVFFHGVNAVLIFLCLRRLLEPVDETGARRDALCFAGAAIFLAHPVQTESVAYVASRSEVLSVFFILSAFLLYLRERARGLSWTTTALVLLLFGAAVTTKEHALALPAVMVVTDLFWSGWSGIKKNGKLYGLLAAGAVIAIYPVIRIIRSSPVIGFGLQGLAWYEYLFTQFRAIWMYLRLFILPAGLNADYDMPVSRTLFDHLAIIPLAGLALLLVLAWRYRQRFPLAAYGLVVFLLLLAPTSSIVPIRDVIAERRMYLPFIGLLLIAIDFARRLRWPAQRFVIAGAALALVLGALTFARSQVWADPLSLWQDTVAKSPGKARPRQQLAALLYASGECSGAAAQYEAVAKNSKPEFDLLLNWALALDCAGNGAEALARIAEAEKLERSAHLYATMGMFLAKQSRNQEALGALAKAEAADANFGITYLYRGNVYMQLGDPARALPEYERALRLDPTNEAARQSAAMARQQLQLRR